MTLHSPEGRTIFRCSFRPEGDFFGGFFGGLLRSQPSLMLSHLQIVMNCVSCDECSLFTCLLVLYFYVTLHYCLAAVVSDIEMEVTGTQYT